jgi:hypothetical protein
MQVVDKIEELVLDKPSDVPESRGNADSMQHAGCLKFEGQERPISSRLQKTKF